MPCDVRPYIPIAPSIVMRKNTFEHVYPRLRRGELFIAPPGREFARKMCMVDVCDQPVTCFGLKTKHALFHLRDPGRLVPVVQEIPLQEVHDEVKRKA